MCSIQTAGCGCGAAAIAQLLPKASPTNADLRVGAVRPRRRKRKLLSIGLSYQE
jgi:hypothetical protein